jgi:hypothetical protein
MQNLTARQIIEARLGKPLGPIATMRPDLKRALYGLALELVKVQHKTQIKKGKK